MLGDFGGIFGFWLGPYQDFDPKNMFLENSQVEPKAHFHLMLHVHHFPFGGLEHEWMMFPIILGMS
jgi:hypothetical protein